MREFVSIAFHVTLNKFFIKKKKETYLIQCVFAKTLSISEAQCIHFLHGVILLFYCFK